MVTSERAREAGGNGEALAAFLAAGIGAFALGLVVILDAAGLFSAPALYPPAGGVTGRTTLGTVIWLVAWAVLHRRWRGRRVEPRGVLALTLLLVAAGVVLTLPPVWGLV